MKKSYYYADGPTYDPVFYYYHSDNLGSSSVMTNRDGLIVQQYGYTAFGDERYQNNTRAFNVTNRYTGQRIDEETGLYFYNSRYYDPELGRFIQADSIVPSSDTSQALNRYAYVKNNPLKFTDPDGHGWLSKAWKHVKQWIGTIITVALMFTPLAPIAPIIGSAIGTWVNGGTFASFAIGVAVGFAAGCIADAMGGAMGNTWTDFAKAVGDIGAKFVAGAVTGAIAGGITSAIYGQNIGKGMGQGAMGGAIGAGVAMVAGAAFTKLKVALAGKGISATQEIITACEFGEPTLGELSCEYTGESTITPGNIRTPGTVDEYNKLMQNYLKTVSWDDFDITKIGLTICSIALKLPTQTVMNLIEIAGNYIANRAGRGLAGLVVRAAGKINGGYRGWYQLQTYKYTRTGYLWWKKNEWVPSGKPSWIEAGRDTLDWTDLCGFSTPKQAAEAVETELIEKGL